jgi:hypothetical protein
MTPRQELRLMDYLGGLMGHPFAYGVNDCPLLAAGVLDCMDGGMRRRAMLGLWNDHKSAWRYLKKHGDIGAHLKTEGCVTVTQGVAFAQVGDLLLMDRTLAHDKEWHSVAVCTGTMAVVMTEATGIVRVSMDALPPVKEVLRWP